MCNSCCNYGYPVVGPQYGYYPYGRNGSYDRCGWLIAFIILWISGVLCNKNGFILFLLFWLCSGFGKGCSTPYGGYGYGYR